MSRAYGSGKIPPEEDHEEPKVPAGRDEPPRG